MAKSDYGKPARHGWSRKFEKAWERLEKKEMTNKEKAEKCFAEELKLIQDEHIKQFVLDVFEQLTPNYFWTVPCSTSGKYHPQVSLGEGGLIRHVKLTVWWGLELLRAMEMEQYQDEMVAALLLHDLIKNGKGLGSDGRPLERGVTGTHGVELAKSITKQIQLSNILIDYNESFDRIITGIAMHMGRWTTIPYNATSCTKLEAFIDLIHLADYCASRKVDDIMAKLMDETVEETETEVLE